jgi:general secretion pathway protein D
VNKAVRIPTGRRILVPVLAALACSGSFGGLVAAEDSAQARLDAVAEEVRKASADRQALASFHHQQGTIALQEGRLEDAVRMLRLAVDYAGGTNATYNADFERAAALAGLSTDARQVHLDALVDAKRVEEQRLWIEIQERVEAGIEHMTAGRYNQAYQSLNMAQIRLESLSVSDPNRAREMNRVQQLLQESEGRRLASEREQARQDLAEANARKRQLREMELKIERQRLDAMLGRAQQARLRRDYDECILYCEQVLKINPADPRAHDLLVRARRERHVYIRNLTAVTWEEQHKLLSEEIRRDMLPQFDVVTYSDDWTEIDRLRSAPTRGIISETEAWRDEIRQQLAQQLTLEFVDAEITDVVQFLQQNTGVNIVLDPQVVESGLVPPITMKVDNIRMDNALEFIMQLSELHYVLRDEALYISNEEGVQGEVAMTIYDIADLTHPLTDFPGPRMRIPEPGEEGQSLVSEIIPDTNTDDIQYFIDIVRNVVAPDSWDGGEEGVSIGEHNGQMVITHSIDVHKQVEQLLHTLRNQRGLQINVAAKWLTVEDGMLEKIGVNLLGYQLEFNDANGDPAALQPDRPTLRNGRIIDDEDVGAFKAGDDNFYLGSVNNREIGDDWYDPTFFGSNAARGGISTQYQWWKDPNGLLGSAIIEAVEQSKRGNVVIEPNITLFNGQRAHLVDLVQEAYVADYDVSGGQYDPVVSVISHGTVLDVRAIASADRKYITLTMQPTQARLVDFFELSITSQVEGVDISAPVDYPIRVPQLEYQSVETTVTIPDGGSILLAGLTDAQSGRKHSGVPFLSHIPFLGRLFSTNARSETERKTIISVRANIVLFDELEAEL